MTNYKEVFNSNIIKSYSITICDEVWTKLWLLQVVLQRNNQLCANLWEFSVVCGLFFLIMTSLVSSWLLTFSTALLIVLLYCMFFGFIVFWLVFYLTSIVTIHTKVIMVTVEHQCFLVGMKTTKLENMVFILNLKWYNPINLKWFVTFKEGGTSEQSCFLLTNWPLAYRIGLQLS